MNITKRTILVTGGAGFIGSHLVRLACRAGHRVINLDKLTYAGDSRNNADILHSDYRFVQGDVTDDGLVHAILREEAPDTIFHLAAESHVDRSIDAPADFITTNVLGTFALLGAALATWRNYKSVKQRAFRFLHVSTDEVFGELMETGTFNENTPYAPSSPYSASKAASDHLARAWHQTYRLPVMVSNCSNNFGPSQYREKFIPTIIRSALQGVPIPLYGRGEQIRDWIYVGDHAEGLMAAAERGKPGGTYLFGGENELRNNEMCDMICAALDAVRPAENGSSYRRLITHVADRPGHDFRYAIDSSRTRAALSWMPRTSLAEGIRKTVEWYLAHPERLEGANPRQGLMADERAARQAT